MSDTPMAGYIVGAVRSAEAPPSKEMVEEFMLDSAESFCAHEPLTYAQERARLPPARRSRCPRWRRAVRTRASSSSLRGRLAKAVEFYEGAEYIEWSSKYGIGTKIKRDMRIIEAPAELFVAGKAYWVALLYQVHDTPAHRSLLRGVRRREHQAIIPRAPLEDGTVAEKAVLEIKWAGPSDFSGGGGREVPRSRATASRSCRAL